MFGLYRQPYVEKTVNMHELICINIFSESASCLNYEKYVMHVHTLYVCIYTYVCVYICIYMRTQMYTHTHTLVYILMDVCLLIYICITVLITSYLYASIYIHSTYFSLVKTITELLILPQTAATEI